MIAFVCKYGGVLVIPVNAGPEYETCVHYDVDWTLHCANLPHKKSCSTVEGGRRCHNFVPVLGGDGTKVAPSGDYLTNPLVK